MSIEQAWKQALTGGNSYFLGHSAINGVHVSEKCELCNGLRTLLKEVLADADFSSRTSHEIEDRINQLGIEEPPR